MDGTRESRVGRWRGAARLAAEVRSVGSLRLWAAEATGGAGRQNNVKGKSRFTFGITSTLGRSQPPHSVATAASWYEMRPEVCTGLSVHASLSPDPAALGLWQNRAETSKQPRTFISFGTLS